MSRRGLRAGHVTEWTPQEPRRPFHLRVNLPDQGPADQTPTSWARPPTSSRPMGAARYRQAKETKRGGMDGRESERAIVPMKPGDLIAGTRRREGLAESWIRCEER